MTRTFFRAVNWTEQIFSLSFNHALVHTNSPISYRWTHENRNCHLLCSASLTDMKPSSITAERQSNSTDATGRFELALACARTRHQVLGTLRLYLAETGCGGRRLERYPLASPCPVNTGEQALLCPSLKITASDESGQSLVANSVACPERTNTASQFMRAPYTKRAATLRHVSFSKTLMRSLRLRESAPAGTSVIEWSPGAEAGIRHLVAGTVEQPVSTVLSFLVSVHSKRSRLLSEDAVSNGFGQSPEKLPASLLIPQKFLERVASLLGTVTPDNQCFRSTCEGSRTGGTRQEPRLDAPLRC